MGAVGGLLSRDKDAPTRCTLAKASHCALVPSGLFRRLRVAVRVLASSPVGLWSVTVSSSQPVGGCSQSDCNPFSLLLALEGGGEKAMAGAGLAGQPGSQQRSHQANPLDIMFLACLEPKPAAVDFDMKANGSGMDHWMDDVVGLRVVREELPF